MARIYDQNIGVIDYPQWWQWHIVIDSSETDTQYTLTVTATLTGSTPFSLDLMQNDIWWTLNFDGSSKEVLRVYLANGRFQTLSAGTYGPYTLTKTYNKIDGEQAKNVSVSVTGSATVYTNMLGITPHNVSFTIPSGYIAPSNLVINPTNSTTNSITTTASWKEGLHPPTTPTATITIGGKTGNITTSGGSTTISGLNSNTKYSVSGSLNDGKTTITPANNNIPYWTYPIINTPVLSLRSGSEHNTIDVSVTASIESQYDQFAYKINSNSWSSWTSNKSYSFSGLSENTEYTITVKMRNTQSSYESAEKTAKIRTWYNPISNLSVVLKNKWFWYLQIGCSFNYNGTITKYEYAVGDDEKWVDKGTTNIHSRGSATPGASSNLNYNTDYNCWVRLTDNHGRTAQASAVFKTLDERPLYVDGQLREVKVIDSNGTVTYVTPNLLSVVKEDGTLVNMNKIINNDNRTQFQ